MDTLYASLVWSVTGFALGWVTCTAAVKIAEADDRRVRAGDMSKRARMDVVRAFLGVLILLMLLVVSVSYYRTTSCQTSYNQAVAEALSARSDYQEREAEAQITLLTATLAGDQEASRRAMEEYMQAVRDLIRARNLHPVPPPPDCGRFG